MAEATINLVDEIVNGKAVKIVSLIGQLDETNVDDEAKKIYEVINLMTEPNLLIDLSQLTYINSKAIGYLTDWYSKAAAKNGKITIAGPQPNILDILKVVGITQIINIHASSEEAKAEFASPEAPAISPPAPTDVPSEPTPSA